MYIQSMIQVKQTKIIILCSLAALSRQHRKSQLPESTRNRTKHHQAPTKVRDRMSLGSNDSSPSNHYKPGRERVSLGIEDPSPSSNVRPKRSSHIPKSHHPDFSLRSRHREPIKQTTKLPYNDLNDGRFGLTFYSLIKKIPFNF